MNTRSLIIGLLVLIFISSCENKWDDHFTVPETVDENLWDAIKRNENLSKFVEYMEEFQYDTLFLKNDTYTLFIPDNEAFTAYTDTADIDLAVMNYHISSHFFQSGMIADKRKLQTFAEKFALFQKVENESLYDGIPLEFESPLYTNGKYFVMGEVAIPKLNLYEYFSIYNPLLKDYIDDLDSIIVDKELSRPVGFDSLGNTVYDTIAIIYNEFEMEYFPVREELRFETATIVFPETEDYNNALTEMAVGLKSHYVDYRDIPLQWQNDLLIPYLLERGVFENMVEPSEFIPDFTETDTFKMRNIRGDSMIIEYLPANKTLCSNGYAYNYENFVVPDTLLYVRMEGESLLEQTGEGTFGWGEDVLSVESSQPFQPKNNFYGEASNDSVLRVEFPKGYTGTFDITFKVRNLLARKYLMVVRTTIYRGGAYNVYFNDEFIRKIDHKEAVNNFGYFFSVTGGLYIWEPTSSNYNKWDCFLNNTAEYNQAKLRIEYIGPSSTLLDNGWVVDYIDFVPYDW